MENYGKIDPQTGIHSRLWDFYKALSICIDTAINEQVDLFLFSGDAYKTAHPTQTQQKLLMQCFLRLYSAGIPVVIIVGNHDHPLSFGKANALDLFGTLPIDGFHVISKPDSVTLTTKNGPITIVGIPWPTRNTISVSQNHLHKSAQEITDYISKAVAHIIKDMAAALDPAVPAILAGHLTVSNGIFSGSEKRAIYGTDPLLFPSDLAIEPFDYVALGHLHRYQDLNAGGYPAVVYSGSIERIDFGERKEEKGFCLVEIPSKGACTHRFIPVPTRPFIQIEVKLTAAEDQTQQVLRALAKHTLTDAVLKIIYYIPDGEADLVDQRILHAACEDAMYIVSIMPIKTVAVRERRLGSGNADMSLEGLLDLYFETKPELKKRKLDLIEKTIKLAHESSEAE
jgi:exonuclease SbcD